MEQEEHPITFYNIQDDIPIGGFAKLGNEVYKVVKEEGCTLCEFIASETFCDNAVCFVDRREDGYDVIFVLYDTIPEDNDEQS